MNKPIINGLLREGELMNIVAPPRTGKTWLALQLAFSVAEGKPFLDFNTEGGKVLYVNTDLQPETLAHRMRQVAKAMSVETNNLSVFSRPLSSDLLETALQGMDSGFPHHALIIIDDTVGLPTDEAFGSMLHRQAERLKCGIVLIHHQSKRAVSDDDQNYRFMRLADTHVELVPQSQNIVGVSVQTRSFPQCDPFFIQNSEFPLWKRITDSEVEAALAKANHLEPI